MNKRMLVTLFCIGFLSGCITVPSSEPNEAPRRVLDPNNPALVGVEAGIEGLGNILIALGVPVGSLLIGAGSVWKGLKPKIVAAQKKANEAERKELLAQAAAQTMADGIEELKAKAPDSWEKLKPIYVEMMRTAPSIEAFIRELRGLPVDKT